jgi:hypothetical protein
VVVSLGGGGRLAESFGGLLLVRPISSLCGVRNWEKIGGSRGDALWPLSRGLGRCRIIVHIVYYFIST